MLRRKGPGKSNHSKNHQILCRFRSHPPLPPPALAVPARRIQPRRNQLHLNMLNDVTMPTCRPLSEEKQANDRQQHGRETIVKMLLCLTLAQTLAPWWAPTTFSGVDSYGGETEAPKTYEVTGTLTELDLARGKGKIRTDLGKSVFLEVRKPELFKNLSVGDRVTILMTGDGRVDKVMGMNVPDLAVTGQPVPPEP